MRKDLEVPMEDFNQMSKSEQIGALCAYHECSAMKQRIHLDDYVYKQWNPHPPQRFVNWWGSVGVKATEKKTDRAWQGVNVVHAFNCQAVRETYTEAKQIGAI